jgi:hypothetical protein
MPTGLRIVRGLPYVTRPLSEAGVVKGDGRDTRGSTPTGVIAATSEIEQT